MAASEEEPAVSEGTSAAFDDARGGLSEPSCAFGSRPREGEARAGR